MEMNPCTEMEVFSPHPGCAGLFPAQRLAGESGAHCSLFVAPSRRTNKILVSFLRKSKYFSLFSSVVNQDPIGTASFWQIQDHPFRPNVKINNTFFRIFQCAVQRTANCDTYGAEENEHDPDPYRHQNGKSDPDADLHQNDADPKFTTRFFR
jgi:hypothetical protein